MSDNNHEPKSIQILLEAAKLQKRKAQDYQNSHSRVRQAQYYRRGLHTINDTIHAKLLRIDSVIEAMENDPTYKPNFESLADSYIDLINYASFGAAWIEGGIDGQDPNDIRLV